MSLPPLNPKKTTAGIAVDPRTLERVIPESRRPDGSVRKQLKIRPGYTPQEDVQRFRSTRQQAVESRALPAGHIPGWVPPSSAFKKPSSSSSRGLPGAGDFPSLGGSGGGGGGEGKALSKAQKKNEKRRQKKKETNADEQVRDNWDSDEEDKPRVGSGAKSVSASASPAHTQDTPNTSEKDKSDSADADAVAEKLSKLDVQ